MSQSPTLWCTDHVLPGLAYDGADGRYGNTAAAIGSASEKKLPSERHGKVIIYPFCWVYHLDLGCISHIDPRSSTLTRTEHFQWQNQVVRILHCITLKVNGFATEKTCPPGVAWSPKLRDYARKWRMHMPCLECAKLFQVNKGRHEGGRKSVEKEGIMKETGTHWASATRCQVSIAWGRVFFFSFFFPHDQWQSACSPGRHQALNWIPSPGSSL